MRITIDIQAEDIKEALEAHIKNQLNIDTSVDVDWLNGRYGITVNLGDTPAYVSDVTYTDKATTKPEPVKRTRRTKEQIEADRLAEASIAIDKQATEEGMGTRTYYEPEEPASDTQSVSAEPSESGLMATIFAEDPEPEEPVKDIFAVEDNSVFAQPATDNIFAIK